MVLWFDVHAIYCMEICYLNRHFLMCNLEKSGLLCLLVSGE